MQYLPKKSLQGVILHYHQLSNGTWTYNMSCGKKVQKKNNLQSDEHYKKQFLFDRCLEDYEKNLQQWAKAKGYNLE